MALPPLAPVSALEQRLGVPVGSLAGLDLARAEANLNDASALVRAEAGFDWVADDGVTITAPDAVVTVTVRAAIRAYRNPDGYMSENLGGSYSYTFAQSEIGVYLLTEEKRVIVKAAADAKATLGYGTVRVPSSMYDPNTDPGMSGYRTPYGNGAEWGAWLL